MGMRFVGQAGDHDGTLHQVLGEMAANDRLTELSVVVAWAKESGLARTAHHLAAIRARGPARLILGIDSRGGTEEGLRAALEAFDEVHVFFDRTGGTFHPKIYLAAGEMEAVVLVGSNNLTAGGVFLNYEAAAVAYIDKSNPEEAQYLEDVRAFISRLQADEALCVRLTPGVLETLLSDPRYGIQKEARPSRSSASASSDSDVQVEPEAPFVFGRTRYARPTDPGRQLPELPTPAGSGPVAEATSGASTPEPRVSGGAMGATLPGAGSSGVSAVVPSRQPIAVVKRWTKALTNSDAQQRQTENTQITGNLKLTQAGHPIDHRTYFRHEFFAPVSWMSEERPRGQLETAEVYFEVDVDGSSLGVFQMTVDHADYRVADQSNVPTWLKWKEFGDYLQQHDQRGKTVTLERMSDGTYRAHIAAGPTGPFM